MDRWAGRVALVTGASAGIGAATCEMLVKHGMKVVGCARNITKIQELSEQLRSASGELHAIKCDLSQEQDILTMFAQIKQQFGGVDVCINNAGLSHPAPLLTGNTEQWKNMLDVNITALCICGREAFKSMAEREVDDGHFIHLSSMSGHRVVANPTGHFYSATKFAVRAIVEGMRNELRANNSHIRVSSISPGLVETEFQYRMLGEDTAKAVYGGIECLQASDIADSVQYILSAPAHVQVHDILLRPTEQVF